MSHFFLVSWKELYGNQLFFQKTDMTTQFPSRLSSVPVRSNASSNSYRVSNHPEQENEQ